MAWTEGPVTLAREGRVAIVSIRRGDRLNALSREVMHALTAVAAELRSDTSTSAVVLHGDPVFSAGVDLTDRALGIGTEVPLIERREALRIGPDLCAAWQAVDQVTICAVEGFCIGGALALAAACDWRISGRGLHFRLPEIPLGMNMSWGTQPRLVSLIGPARAKRLVIFGERVPAEQAEAWEPGRRDHRTTAEGLCAGARAWARQGRRPAPDRRPHGQAGDHPDRRRQPRRRDLYGRRPVRARRRQRGPARGGAGLRFEKRAPNFKGKLRLL